MSRVLTDSQLTVVEAYSDTGWYTIYNNNITRLNNVLLKMTGLLDVDTSGLSDGDIIVWSEAASKWIAYTPPFSASRIMPTTTSTSTSTTTTTTTTSSSSTSTTSSSTVSTASTSSSSVSTVSTKSTQTTLSTTSSSTSSTSSTSTTTTSPPFIFNEDFEGTGYENEDWTEQESDGGTLDPDVSTTRENWGSQCLECAGVWSTGASAYIRKEFDPTLSKAYIRIEFEIISLDHDNLGIVRFGMPGDMLGTWAWNLRIYDTDTLELSVNYGGVNSPSVYGTPLTTGVKYRVEVFWEQNGDWEWKVNDVTVESGTSTEDIGSVFSLNVGICWCSTYVALEQIMRFDHIEVNTTTWPGA